ncbi:unnamed protein product [Mycena citricolor]|uniref:ARID domain-containing protein n=1 Tax=Mycena citricolor TaxID=2018698 RepID=A0AAD2H609_9AGAR|nr:unnamed protein product [Mycena citricolor]
MADRYNMLPAGFPQGVVQHQQLGQQMGQSHLQLQQQQQDNHNQPFPDQWPQMQQMQNQFRPGSNPMDPSHLNPQVAELMRSQQLSRAGQQPQPQAQFPLHQSSPQSFPDGVNQQQPGQSHSNFQNMNPSMQALNNRNNMMQSFQQPNNPATHRQLELMALAHSQQPQNGSMNFPNRMQHQAAVGGQANGMGSGQAPQAESFLSPVMQPNLDGMRRPSPSGPMQPGVPPNGGGPAHPNRATYATLQERAANLKNIITNQENQLVQLTSQRTRMGDASFMERVRDLSADLKNRKEYYARLIHFLKQMSQQQQQLQGQVNGQGGGNMPMNQPPPPPPAWMSNPSQPQVPFNTPSNSTPPGHGPPAGHGSPQMRPTPPAVGPVPPRGGPSSAQFPNSLAAAAGELRIPPLERSRFEQVYKNFCTQRNIVHNPRMLMIEARQLDLYELHSHVMQEGGLQAIVQKELWSTIGGRMGFVQFPGTDQEPPKSGPMVAQQLFHIYKEYLASFDNVYISTVMESRRKAEAVNATQRIVPGAAGNAGPQLPIQHVNQQQMQMIMSYAHLSAAELRRRNIPENMIMFVENHRATLARNAAEQGNFRHQLAGPREQTGMNPGFPPSGAMMSGNVNRPFPGPHGPMAELMNGPGGLLASITRPSRETVQAAINTITKLKQEFSPERMMQNVPPIEIPPEQRADYNTLLEQLHRASTDLDQKLPMLCATLKREEIIRRLVIIVQTAYQQRAMISSGSTRYLVTLDSLRLMLAQVQQMNENFSVILANLVNKPAGQGNPVPGPLPGQMPGPIPGQMPAQMPGQIPAQLPGQISGQMSGSMSGPMPPRPGPIPPASAPSAARPMNLRDPPIRKTKTPGAPSPAAPSPTPPPSTPRDMASPQAPKSPKGKGKSKVTPKRKPSNAKPASTPVPMPEPVTAPSPGKRAREEDSSPPQSIPGPSSMVEPSPPKRQKTEWDGPPSESLKARADQFDKARTEEDSATLLEQMTELFKMASDSSGQDSGITRDFSETLDTIFKDFGGPDEFVEFFDFSSFGPDEDAAESESKAATPDLVSSTSSTNPSPESLSETDPKPEDYNDFLRLGVWKEVDGGESAHFHSGQWKWDSPMQTLEQPWAVHP